MLHWFFVAEEVGFGVEHAVVGDHAKGAVGMDGGVGAAFVRVLDTGLTHKSRPVCGDGVVGPLGLYMFETVLGGKRLTGTVSWLPSVV